MTGDTSKEWRVHWEIDVYADSPENAARRALAIQRDPASTATVFAVQPREDLAHESLYGLSTTVVDLSDELNDADDRVILEEFP